MELRMFIYSQKKINIKIMTYDSLRKLPKVTFIEIHETGNIRLLTDDDKITDENLMKLWTKLNDEFDSKYNKDNQVDKLFNVKKEIDFQTNRYLIIKYACDALLFQKTDDLIELLKENRYIITDENYIKDIERVIRDSEGILDKINNLKKQLPKEKESKQNEYSIIDVMQSFADILGYNFDFYKISVEEFFVKEKAVLNKIKMIEKQNSNNK